MKCKATILTCLLLVASTAKTEAPVSTSAFLACQMTSSIFFEGALVEYFQHAETCKQVSFVPSRKRIANLSKAMWTACNHSGIKPFNTWIYPGTQFAPEWRPYFLFSLMMTESGGKSHNTSKPEEKTYGPWCVTIAEARGACYLLKEKCPRASWEIAEKLQENLDWSALMALAAWEFYAESSRGDVMMGLMKYKYGATRFRDILVENNGEMKKCNEHIKFSKKLDTVRCMVAQMGYGNPCFCFENDQ